MAVTGIRSVSVVFSGDVQANNVLAAANNAASPGDIDIQDLASGFNSITKPTGATAVTIVPPSGNTESITLKGVTGDTGIRIHDTDPTSIALDASVTAIGLTAGDTITGVRFYWS